MRHSELSIESVRRAYNRAIEGHAMSVEVAPMLAVSHGHAAIEFYKSAFDAKVLWHLGKGADIVAGPSIDGAKFFLAYEAPKYGTRGPPRWGLRRSG